MIQSNASDPIGEVVPEEEVEALPDTIFRRLDRSDGIEWVRPLRKMNIATLQNVNKRPNVYIKYTPIINGYEVTCRFIPFGIDSETGYMLMRFHSRQADFIYECDKATNFHLTELAYSGITWKDGDIYEFDYIQPTIPSGYNSPLGYYSPFQFIDIDFDGEKELLINDFYRGQQGNNYEVYKIKNNTLIPLHTNLPFSYITNTTVIDTLNKRIGLYTRDGAIASSRVYFTKQMRAGAYITELPQFRSYATNDFGLNNYITQTQLFAIDSIWEQYIDSVFIYRRHNMKIELVSSEIISTTEHN